MEEFAPFSVCLLELRHLILFLLILSSLALGLRFTPSGPLLLRLLDSNLHRQFSWVADFRGQIVGLSLCNHMSQFFIICTYVQHIYVYIDDDMYISLEDIYIYLLEKP